MSPIDDRLPRLGYVEPLESESISHYLGRLRRLEVNSLPSAYALGQAAEIGSVTCRWEKLYFNPLPTVEELSAIACLIGLDVSRLQEMLPSQEMRLQPRPIRLCAHCYDRVPCHRMEWQYKDIIAFCPNDDLRLLERCPHCKTPFQIPALWSDGRCHRCQMNFTSMAKYQRKRPN